MVSLHTYRKLLQISPTLNSTSYNNINDTNDANNDNYPTVQTCLNNYCNSKKKTTNQGFCPQVCLALCPSICHYSTNPIPLPLNYPTKPNKPHIINNNNHSPLLISMLILLAITFLLIIFYIIYTKLYFHFYAPYNSNSFLHARPRSHNNNNNTIVSNNINININSSLDGGLGVMFHPFWHISTVGLPTTAIQRIAVVKYHKEVMDEKDCAVCLAGYEEGESLRVLPKCSHVFHLACIDTWLSLHTTCPLCRAPIIDHHHHVDDHNNIDQTVENASSSSVVVAVESTRENNNNSLHDNNEELRVVNNNSNDAIARTTIEELGENNNNLENYYCIENFRRVNNKGSLSQRWSLERGTANLLSRSLSCSGKIFFI